MSDALPLTDAELVSEAIPTRSQAHPFREALDRLRESGVRHVLLRDRLDMLEQLADLDLLIDARQQDQAFRVLENAGFLCKRNRALRSKWVFVRYHAGRFHTIDLHGAFVQAGIVYMEGRVALERIDATESTPRLSPEDEFLHLLLHNLLGKPSLQEKHTPRLQALHHAGLDASRLQDQTRRFGIDRLVEEALANLPTLVGDPVAWRGLRRRVRRRLLRRPDNVLGALRFRYANRIRRGRPVLIALLGPDGCGKTTFTNALEEKLRKTPLRAGRVYMGCWGHDHLPMRQVRRLTPPLVSHLRMLTRSLRPGVVWRTFRVTLKSSLFFAALGIEMTYRYVRFIGLSRRPLVISDRYIYDLEFRHGKVPYPHGQWARRLLYRVFPSPDYVLYLSVSYDLVEIRKPQLGRQQFEVMDRVFRGVVPAKKTIEIRNEAPPEEGIDTFLTRYWRSLVDLQNRRG